MSSNLALTGELDKMCEEEEPQTPLLVGKPEKQSGRSFSALGEEYQWKPLHFLYRLQLRPALCGTPAYARGQRCSRLCSTLTCAKSCPLVILPVTLSTSEEWLGGRVGPGSRPLWAWISCVPWVGVGPRSLTWKGDTGFKGALPPALCAWHSVVRGVITVGPEQSPPKAMLSKHECAYISPESY